MLLKFFYATTNVPKNLSVKVQKESMPKKKNNLCFFLFFSMITTSILYTIRKSNILKLNFRLSIFG